MTSENPLSQLPSKSSISSFGLWRETKKQILKTMPLMDATKILSKEWAELDQNEKDKWKRKASREYIKYIKQLALLKKTNPELYDNSDISTIKKRKREKQITGYSLFCKSERESVSHLPLNEQSKELGSRWRGLDEEKRNEWNSKAEKEKLKSNNESETPSVVKPPSNKKQKTQETVTLPNVKKSETKPQEKNEPKEEKKKETEQKPSQSENKKRKSSKKKK